MTNPSQWVPGLDQTPPPTPKKSRTWLFGLLAFAGLILLACAFGAVILAGSHKGDTPLRPVPTVTTSVTSDYPTTAPKATSGLTKNDVKLTLNKKTQQCYGFGVGCSVEVGVNAAVDAAKLGDNSWEITYTITGATEGPVIGTIIVDPDKSYVPGDESFTTRSKDTKLTVTVTRVEKIGF